MAPHKFPKFEQVLPRKNNTGLGAGEGLEKDVVQTTLMNSLRNPQNLSPNQGKCRVPGSGCAPSESRRFLVFQRVV